MCRCGHLVDPHVLATLYADVMDGGLMFCPDCDCVQTWSAEGRPRPVMPPPSVVAEVRAAVLGA